ncbi:hypothetical protein H9Q72_005152 [Fusarium xylarioides]|uniref:Xylanolytic transcriptional activator regulatory domain-containing protein n=1 Tax=Fusarium xylarioides TaxID=221167 RepID=A0A9P7HVT2_9HYPO|nr:hypothetical protein H9Q72_005152 [Fusarium xylarioides]
MQKLTSQSESKIDSLSEKLDTVLASIENLESSFGQIDASARTNLAESTPLSLAGSALFRKTPVEDHSGSELHRDAVLATQAAFATTFAQKAVDSSHLLQVSPDVRPCLEALRDGLKERGPSHGNPKPPATHGILADAKSSRLRFCWCMEIDVGQFVDYFFTVYSGTPSLADLIIVHCGLHNLLVPYGKQQKDKTSQEDIKSQGSLCQQNLESILANLPFSIPSTYDFALALLMTTTYFVQRCSMSQAWSYLAAAAHICLTLGYHREVPSKPEKKQERQRRVRLFWLLYIMDKLLALRLNRPPLLRDRDITVSYENYGETALDSSLPIAPKWIKMGMLYGRIYDEIFSPGALLQPSTQRDTRARELAVELDCLFDSKDPVEESFMEEFPEYPDDPLPGLVRRADRISHLAIITLIYRGIKPSSNTGSAFCNECLSSAKQCLEEHREAFRYYKMPNLVLLSSTCNGKLALLAAPFVPFIVLFCHAIETRDPSHLENLSAVVRALQILPRETPDVYGKQRRVFELMYSVACKYVSEQGSSQHQHQRRRPFFGVLLAEAGVPMLGETQMNPEMQNLHTEMEYGPDGQIDGLSLFSIKSIQELYYWKDIHI